MKKSLKFILAILMFFITGSVMAAEVTIKDALCRSDSSYLFYKIFFGDGFRERLSVDSSWREFFETGEGRNLLTLDYDGFIASFDEHADMEAIANAAYAYAIEKNITPAYDSNDEDVNASCLNRELKINVNNGYYLIKSPKGRFLTLMDIEEDSIIDEKNHYSSANILVKNGDNYLPATGASFGNMISFTIDVTLTPGTSVFKLEDFSETGLVVDTDSIAVHGCDADDFSISFEDLTKENSVFAIEFDEDYLNSIVENKNISIKFGAIYTKDAKEQALYYLPVKNYISYVYYEDQNVPDNAGAGVYSWTAGVESFYTTSREVREGLPGVHYIISKNEDGSNPIRVVRDRDGLYRVAVEGDSSTTDLVFNDEEGEFSQASISVYGLNAGTYYFIPTSMPLGFNLVGESPFKVEINPFYDEEERVYRYTKKNAKVEFTNESFLLPKTGGVGTTILLVVGLFLFIVSLAIIITKLRNTNN